MKRCWPPAALQGAHEYRHRLPPLQFRASSADEATPYLAEPVFSSCTVPVVYYRSAGGGAA